MNINFSHQHHRFKYFFGIVFHICNKQYDGNDGKNVTYILTIKWNENMETKEKNRNEKWVQN